MGWGGWESGVDYRLDGGHNTDDLSKESFWDFGILLNMLEVSNTERGGERFIYLDIMY